VVRLTAYGRLITYAYRLEAEYRRERDAARRAKLLVRLALARVALAEDEPTRAVVVWRSLARAHLHFWDQELDHPEWDPLHETVGTDDIIAFHHNLEPAGVDASDELKRVALDPGLESTTEPPAEEFLMLPK
jgi:hypothetical protein